MARPRLAGWLLAALLLVLTAAGAEEKKPPPAGMTPEQYQSMVDDISDAVAKKLEGERKGGKKGDKPARAAEEASPAAKSEPFDAIAAARRLRDQSSRFLATVPDYPVAVAGVRGALDFEFRGEKRTFAWMLQWLLISALAGIAAEYAVRALLTRIRKRWQATRSISPKRRYAACVGIDVLATSATLLVVGLMSDLWLPAEGSAADLGSKLLTLFFLWRISALVLQVWFRPDDAECRIVAVGDADAALLARALSLLILAYQVGDGWMHIQTLAGMHVAALEVALLVDNIYSSIADLAFIWFTRHATARWLTALVREDKGWFIGAKLALAKYWVVLALTFEVVMSSVQYYGSISGNVGVSFGLSTTLQAILLLLLLESAMDLPRRLADAAAAGAPRRPGVGELAADMVLVYWRLTFIIFLVRIWSVEVLALFTPEQFAEIRIRNIATGLMVFFAYVIWKIASFMIDRAMSTARTFVRPGDEDAVQQPQGAASRVHTVLPLIRATIAVTIVVLLVLVVLSQLGVNITPLIAGASVLGLAISFGSQTLVKDIVSGIFYLVDDAFRVGDYIDTGRVKGTVEGFTLRSIKLRHQNGQVHTIPFGQLGAVTNFSRDWVTVKFNLRLARDVNMEQVRKTVKKIGQDMMADAELGPELLVPLKLQGVADIADNALVMRFKFTCKPTNPSIIQRQAIKRIYQTFNEKGINFASSAITVQTAAGQADPDPALAAAGAAAAAATAAALKPAKS
jgi:small-conductance mechanosensitive channel